MTSIYHHNDSQDAQKKVTTHNFHPVGKQLPVFEKINTLKLRKVPRTSVSA